ncbi:MAG: hypothetical protein ACK56E_14130 [Planctomyces sp.]
MSTNAAQACTPDAASAESAANFRRWLRATVRGLAAGYLLQIVLLALLSPPHAEDFLTPAQRVAEAILASLTFYPHLTLLNVALYAAMILLLKAGFRAKQALPGVQSAFWVGVLPGLPLLLLSPPEFALASALPGIAAALVVRFFGTPRVSPARSATEVR